MTLKKIYNQILLEALKPSEFRKLRGIARDVANKRIDGIWDKLKSQSFRQNRNGERLYFNVEENQETTTLEKEISDYLDSKGFEIVDFKTNQAKKKGDKNVTKIGKILTMIGKSDPGAIELLNQFNTSNTRGGAKTSPLIVISRSAYDIGGASTDRGWTSCMNLRGGMNSRYIDFDISQGSMVAYYIRSDDLNIKNPMGRIMIKPFVSTNGGDVIYGIERDDVKYGTAPRSFPKTIIKMLDNAQGEKIGVFEIDQKLYQDSGKTKIVKFDPKQIENVKSKLEGKIKELRNGLTYEMILKNYSWLLEADFSDAVLGVTAGLTTGFLIWYNGTWKGGIWQGGIWQGGIWETGTWKWGTWTDGTWVSGTWVSGTWENGTWRDGVWETGTWYRGSWKNGTWEKGVWWHGTWEKGTWQNGMWMNGVWEKGVWEDGTWRKGTWEDGTWKDGDWESGTWEDGVWEGGEWENGVWQSSEPHPNER
jgi:hypothetical protein